MFSKTNLVSTLVTALYNMFGGYLFWELILGSFLESHLGTATGVMKENPDFAWLSLGCLLTGFAFSTIYSKWARGVHSSSNGFKYGAWIGFLMGFGDRISEYGIANMLDLTGTLTNAVTYVIFFGIMGVIVSFIYGKMNKKA